MAKVRDANIVPIMKLLLYGDTGSGKTSFAARSYAPLAIVTERNAIQAMKHWCIDDNASFFYASSADDVMRIIKQISKPSKLDNGLYGAKVDGEDVKFSTVYLDSISDLQEKIMINHSKETYGSSSAKLEFDDWRIIRDKGREIAMAIQSIPLNTIVLCHSETIKEGNDNRIVPMLDGSIRQSFGKYYSGVGYTHKVAASDSDIVFKIKFNGGSRFVTKGIPGCPAEFIATESNRLSINDIGMMIYGDSFPHGAEHSVQRAKDAVASNKVAKATQTTKVER